MSNNTRPTENETTGKYLCEYRLKLEKVARIEAFAEPFTNVADVEPMCRTMIGTADREYLIAVALGCDARPIGVHTVSIGTLTDTSAHPRETYKFALETSAHAVIIAHNHVTEDVTPSDADISTTRRMIEAGMLLGVPLLAHLIIGHAEQWCNVFDYLEREPEPEPDNGEPSEPEPEDPNRQRPEREPENEAEAEAYAPTLPDEIAEALRRFAE